ncbi:LuxR family transcriptional regulator [Rhodobacteraceae bacterium RKSG542]|uniref:helix-turn-helix transcriptional regulator n=1 Tax=Pseudovibrio flavus TaxID=2529854 RepID=UPI0012BCE504|nr:helix-turn-helix transcriptional regulator [Pseudovibrio flavus]MTI18626.1 LuxR family transcriptional regulator [Pseudovibrio flavus]
MVGLVTSWAGKGAHLEHFELAEFFASNPTAESAFNKYRQLLNRFDFWGGMYGLAPEKSPGSTEEAMRLLSNYSESFMREYVHYELLVTDPLAQHCIAGRTTPLSWCIEGFRPEGKQQDILADLMKAEGELNSEGQVRGVAFSVGPPDQYGLGGVSLMSAAKTQEELNRQLEASWEQVQGLANMLHAYMIQPSITQSLVGLTTRELECLHWLAAGMNVQQIADRLGRADATIQNHIATASRKLRANNRTQAVSRAMLLGLINL